MNIDTTRSGIRFERLAASAALSLVAPLALSAQGLLLQEWIGGEWGDRAFNAGFMSMLAAGVAGVLCLPITWPERFLVLPLYLAVMGCVLFVWTLSFVCVMFGRCL